MLRFKFQQLELGRRFYVPLPKLTSEQTGILALRFKSLGFSTSETEVLRATKGRSAITLERRGLCSSNGDLTDILAPAIPRLLSAGKEAISFDRLCGSYFRVGRVGHGLVLKLYPRLESSSIWDALRASGSCGLTPDERAVYSLLLSRSGLASEILTDYPTEDCTARMIGRKRYYSCRIQGSEAAASLGESGVEKSRNSYLPRSSVVLLTSFKPSGSKVRSILEGLGEWCFLAVEPTPRKL